MNSNIN